MERLSQATGRTKSSIYHHVSGKEELLRLAVSRALDALFAVLEEDGATSGPAVERLEHVVRGSARVLAAELPYVTLLLRVRGNTATERWALERRRGPGCRASRSWCAGAAAPRPSAGRASGAASWTAGWRPSCARRSTRGTCAPTST